MRFLQRAKRPKVKLPSTQQIHSACDYAPRPRFLGHYIASFAEKGEHVIDLHDGRKVKVTTPEDKCTVISFEDDDGEIQTEILTRSELEKRPKLLEAMKEFGGPHYLH